ncbi:HU family DNA-binding protein [Saccharicrinis aurantiacus]|uniref:HU family DNA-binding protein n=1 Tax=Saccharicrinis aurantiacus TaxID=1849719 RepID=UPI002492FBFD|nr:HU family DNA-binding protein [Saccharicrinis aurantiacus]
MIEYIITALEDPRNRPNKKYYARPAYKATRTLNDAEQHITKASSLTKAETRGVVISLVDYIKQALLDGESVKIDGLGTFFLRTQSEGKNTEKEVSFRDFKNTTIGFKTDAELRKDVARGAQFRKKPKNK